MKNEQSNYTSPFQRGFKIERKVKPCNIIFCSLFQTLSNCIQFLGLITKFLLCTNSCIKTCQCLGFWNLEEIPFGKRSTKENQQLLKRLKRKVLLRNDTLKVLSRLLTKRKTNNRPKKQSTMASFRLGSQFLVTLSNFTFWLPKKKQKFQKKFEIFEQKIMTLKNLHFLNYFVNNNFTVLFFFLFSTIFDRFVRFFLSLSLSLSFDSLRPQIDKIKV